jgi:hypothetical protein
LFIAGNIDFKMACAVLFWWNIVIDCGCGYYGFDDTNSITGNVSAISKLAEKSKFKEFLGSTDV